MKPLHLAQETCCLTSAVSAHKVALPLAHGAPFAVGSRRGKSASTCYTALRTLGN